MLTRRSLFRSFVGVALAPVAAVLGRRRPLTDGGFYPVCVPTLAIVGDDGPEVVTLPKRPPYGHVTVENCFEKTGRSSVHARVYLNGVDMTPREQGGVQEADDVHGFIVRYARRLPALPGGHPRGGYYLGPDGKLACETVYGHVEIRFMELGIKPPIASPITAETA